MATMIETAARALYDVARKTDEMNYFGFQDSGRDGGKTILDGAYDLEDFVVAVLKGIREAATDEMLISGAAVLPEHDEPLQEDAANCWQAMIDAALAEKE